MDRKNPGQRTRHADDVLLEKDEKAVCSDRRRGGQQIQRYIFRFLSSLCLAITLCGADVEGPFNHKKHVPLKLKCIGCHVTAESGDLASFPKVAQCKTCHVEISERMIPSQRLYSLPDFVFFAHGKHAAAKVECATCHGDVGRQDKLELAQALKMKWCVDCHRQNKAVTTCNTCHELGQ